MEFIYEYESSRPIRSTTPGPNRARRKPGERAFTLDEKLPSWLARTEPCARCDATGFIAGMFKCPDCGGKRRTYLPNEDPE